MTTIRSPRTCAAETTSSRITAVLLALASSAMVVGCGGEIGAAEDSSAEIGTSSSEVIAEEDAFAAEEEALYVGETYAPTIGGGGGLGKGTPCHKDKKTRQILFCEQFDRCVRVGRGHGCVTVNKCETETKLVYSAMQAAVWVDERHEIHGNYCGVRFGLKVGCEGANDGGDEGKDRCISNATCEVSALRNPRAECR